MKELIVSLRGKEPHQTVHDIFDYYQQFGGVIKSAFGFVEHMPIYGGRVWQREEISKKDLQDMYDIGVGLELPLTSSSWDSEDYKITKELLKKYDREGNIITVYSDTLHEMLKNDFKHFKVKASVTAVATKKDIDAKIEQGYDYIVLPTIMNDRIDLVSKIEQKEKIVFFGSAGCSWNCPKKTCYEHISKINSKREVSSLLNWCSKKEIQREDKGYVVADTTELEELGFNKFKYLRETHTRPMHKVF